MTAFETKKALRQARGIVDRAGELTNGQAGFNGASLTTALNIALVSPAGPAG